MNPVLREAAHGLRRMAKVPALRVARTRRLFLAEAIAGGPECGHCGGRRRVFAVPPDDAERPWRLLRRARWQTCPGCGGTGARPSTEGDPK